MVSKSQRIKRVASFSEIEINRVEYVTFFKETDLMASAVGTQISQSFLRSINIASLDYAFVNMIGGEFIIVDSINI